jgi:hypothetical protein
MMPACARGWLGAAAPLVGVILASVNWGDGLAGRRGGLATVRQLPPAAGCPLPAAARWASAACQPGMGVWAITESRRLRASAIS